MTYGITWVKFSISTIQLKFFFEAEPIWSQCGAKSVPQWYIFVLFLNTCMGVLKYRLQNTLLNQLFV